MCIVVSQLVLNQVAYAYWVTGVTLLSLSACDTCNNPSLQKSMWSECHIRCLYACMAPPYIIPSFLTCLGMTGMRRESGIVGARTRLRQVQDGGWGGWIVVRVSVCDHAGSNPDGTGLTGRGDRSRVSAVR